MRFLVLWAALIAAATTSCAPALAQTAAGVGAALTAPDKTAVTLSGVLVTSADANERRLVVRESADPAVEIQVFASISIYGIQRDQPVDVAGHMSTLADGTRAIEGAMVYAYVDAEGKVFPMPAPPGVGPPAIPDASVGRGMSAMTEEEGGGTPSGSPCEFAWLATVADALAAEDGDPIGLKNKRIVAAGTDLNYQYYIDIADDGGQDVLRIYCSMAATTSQRVARVAGIITVDGNDINLSAGDGPCGGACGQQQPWLADSATVGIARTLPDGAMVAFDDLVVTHESSSGGYLYAQDQSRAAGIRVNRGEVTTSVTRGDTIDVLGELGHIAATGEQFVDASAITVTGTTGSLRPVKVLHREIGGNGFDIGGLAPPTVGLFVKTFAKVTAKGADYLDVTDFTRVNPPDDTRVFLPCAPSAAIQVGDWAEITGVATVTSTGSPPVLTPGILVQSLEDVQLTNVAVDFTYPDPGPYGHPRVEGVAYTVGPGSIAGVVARTCDTCDWENAVFVQETGRWAFSIPEPFGISDVTVKATDSYGRWATTFKQVKPVTVLLGGEQPVSPFMYGTVFTANCQITEFATGEAGGNGVWRKDGAGGYDWDAFVLECLKQMRPGSLRFGDAASNTYKWRFGVGPQAERPAVFASAGAVKPRIFAYGIAEHLDLCRVLEDACGYRPEPVIVLPWVGTLSTAIAESRNLVLFCNAPKPTAINDDWRPTVIDRGQNLTAYDPALPGQYTSGQKVKLNTGPAAWVDSLMLDPPRHSNPGVLLAFECKLATAAHTLAVTAPYFGASWRDYWDVIPPVEILNPEGLSYLTTDPTAPADYWAWLRNELTGHEDPYNVTYWEVGNQVFFPEPSAAVYKSALADYKAAIPGAGTTVKLGACLPSWREDHDTWPGDLLGTTPYDFDFIVPHFYISTPEAEATQSSYNLLLNDLVETRVDGDLENFIVLAGTGGVDIWSTEMNTMFGFFEYKERPQDRPDNFKLKSALAAAALQMKMIAKGAVGSNLFHACGVSNGDLATAPQDLRAVVVDKLRDADAVTGAPPAQRQWVTPTYYAQKLLGQLGRGIALATDASYQGANRDVFAQVFEDDERYRIFLLNTNATSSRAQNIYLGAANQASGLIVAYVLTGTGANPMEATNECQYGIGVPEPEASLYLYDGNYFSWGLPPASLTVLDIPLNRPAENRPCLAGVVQSTRCGRALVDVEVQAAPSGGPVTTVRTNAFGLYEFAGLAPGEYTITAVTPGHIPLPGSAPVTVDADELLALHFPSVARLQGHVRLANDDPARGAVVWTTQGDRTVTDCEGEFELPVAPGVYTLRAYVPGITGVVQAVPVDLTELGSAACFTFTLSNNPAERSAVTCQ